MGFMLVTSVLVVSLGRIGDMYGRVRMFNLGFAIFTVFSILLAVTWMTGTAGALWIIVMRLGQGVGGAFLFANSSAILTDAFPENERGMALGINGVAAIGGSFLGLILGGVLAPIEWHLVFIVSVPIGLFGTVWSLLKLHDNGVRTQEPDRLDRQRPVRGGSGRRADRHHLRAATPTAATPWAGPGRSCSTCLLGGLAVLVAVRGRRDAGRRPDVPPRPLPQPGLQRWATSAPCSPPWPAVACSSC